MIFWGDLTYLGCFSCNICVKGCFFFFFLNTTYLGSFAIYCFVIFYRLLCLKDPINYTCLGAKLLHDYLLRVEKRGKNTCLGCQIPLL